MYGLCCCTTEINCPAGLPRWLRGEKIHLQCRRHKRRGFDPSIRKIPWRRSWQSTQVFLSGESVGERSQTSYSLWGHKESDKTEQLNAHSRNQRNIVKQLSWNLRERASYSDWSQELNSLGIKQGLASELVSCPSCDPGPFGLIGIIERALWQVLSLQLSSLGPWFYLPS